MQTADHVKYQAEAASINVNPVVGGGGSVGNRQGFDVKSIPWVGTLIMYTCL